jgi:hypothetical protein
MSQIDEVINTFGKALLEKIIEESNRVGLRIISHVVMGNVLPCILHTSAANTNCVGIFERHIAVKFCNIVVSFIFNDALPMIDQSTLGTMRVCDLLEKLPTMPNRIRSELEGQQSWSELIGTDVIDILFNTRVAYESLCKKIASTGTNPQQ